MSDFNSEDYLTREEACGRLGVSGSVLWARTREKKFHPIRLGNRVFYPVEEITNAAYEAEEIRGKIEIGRLAPPRGPKSLKKLEKELEAPLGQSAPSSGKSALGLKALPYTGDEAAKAFVMFDANKNKREVLEALKLRCDIVEHLYDKWREFGNELHIPQNMVKIMQARFKWTESPPSAKGFWAALVAYVDEEARSHGKGRGYEPITEEERKLLEAEEADRAKEEKATPAATSPAATPPMATPPVAAPPAATPPVAFIGEKTKLGHLWPRQNQTASKGSTGVNAMDNSPKISEPDDGSLPFC
jgi:hypothetical protein